MAPAPSADGRQSAPDESAAGRASGATTRACLLEAFLHPLGDTAPGLCSPLLERTWAQRLRSLPPKVRSTNEKSRDVASVGLYSSPIQSP